MSEAIERDQTLEEVLVGKYGTILGLDDLSSVLKLNKRTLLNRIYRGDEMIKELQLIKDGNRYLSTAKDVAGYLEKRRI